MSRVATIMALSFSYLLATACDGSITTSEEEPEPGGSDGGSVGSVDAAGGGGPADGGFAGEVPGEPASLQGITNAHNNVRAAHGVAAMTWDDDLEAVAKAWADGCVWGHNAGRSDNYPGYVGENIYGASFTPTGQQVTDSWASEEADYDYATNSCSGVCGHYTQIVWADSTKLGCAIANCPNIQTSNFVVCDYAPGGNFGGQRPY